MSPLPKTGPYPSVLHDQYPKFLAEDSQLELQKLRLEEKQAMIHKQCKRYKSKALEERRLRMERDNFLKEVEATRIQELRRCYETKIRSDDLNSRNIYMRKQNAKNDLCYHQDFNANVGKNSMDEESQVENCQKLQDQVKKLESEVETLLKAVDSSATS